MLIAVHSPSVCPSGWSTGGSGSSLLISLAVALGVSVVVISAQAIGICKRRNCGHCGGELVFIKVIELSFIFKTITRCIVYCNQTKCN